MIEQFLGGPAGYLVLFAVMVIQAIIAPIPSELVVIAAGKIYGLWPTTIVGGIGLWAGSMLVYFFGRYLRRHFDRFFSGPKLKRVINRLHEHETPLLWVRILPYNPSDIIAYGAGIIGTEPRKFLLINTATSFARVFMLAWLGERITSLSTFLSVAGLLAVSALVAYGLVYRRKRL